MLQANEWTDWKCVWWDTVWAGHKIFEIGLCWLFIGLLSLWMPRLNNLRKVILSKDEMLPMHTEKYFNDQFFLFWKVWAHFCHNIGKLKATFSDSGLSFDFFVRYFLSWNMATTFFERHRLFSTRNWLKFALKLWRLY